MKQLKHLVSYRNKAEICGQEKQTEPSFSFLKSRNHLTILQIYFAMLRMVKCTPAGLLLGLYTQTHTKEKVMISPLSCQLLGATEN